MTDFASSQQLIAALCNPACFPHAAKSVRVLETHISWVLLAGRFAYKVKKPVDLGFLDFTDLADRRFYCEEEIRLNRRLAPHLYLDVVAIGGSVISPTIGAQPAIEYAVRMRRFASANMMDRLLAQGQVTPQHIDSLAATVARFHAGLPAAAANSGFGSVQAIEAPMRQNFAQLAQWLCPVDAVLLPALQAASEREFEACRTVFEQRRQAGFVRECHGDLHLGNIVLLRGKPTPFDGIEFDAGLRWSDVMNEVAFLVMDLLHRCRADLAYRFLNAYLEITGDYAGVAVLRFYLAYRATVRAKISAISEAFEACRSYLQLAGECLSAPSPSLIITHGLPGCGKTTVSQLALEKLPAIRIRSDVERKRLFGLAAHESSRERIPGGIYGAEATRQTYDHLLQLSRVLIGHGFTVIVDAAFLQQAERAQFQALTAELKVPFAILSVSADLHVLRQRIRQRMQHGKDASEADIAVLEKLHAVSEPLQPGERESVAELVNDGEAGEMAASPAWQRLQQLLRRAAR